MYARSLMLVLMLITSFARRVMARSEARIAISVPFVPLLMVEFPTFLLLMFAQRVAITVVVSLLPLVITQSALLGSLVFPLTAHAPIIAAIAVCRIRAVVVPLSGSIVTRSIAITRRIAAYLD